MDASHRTFSEVVGLVRSWLPWRSEPANVSRDFWMPDKSCRKCYECDVQFTIFNRRHHCRLCGRVFCAKCTSNSVPAPSGDPKTSCEEWEKIRVCNYCFKQWEKGIVTFNNGIHVSTLVICPSPSAASLDSAKSTITRISSTPTFGSVLYSSGPYQQPQHISGISPNQSSLMDPSTDRQAVVASKASCDCVTYSIDPSPGQYRSDDDDYYYSFYQSDSEIRNFPQENDYYDQVDFDEISNDLASQNMHLDAENVEEKSTISSPLQDSFDVHNLEGVQPLGKKEDEHDTGDESEEPSSYYPPDDDAEAVDFENNGLLWLPPEPEDEEDERENFDDDDDDDDGDATGDWGPLRSSGSFGSGDFRNRDRLGEENKKAIKNVVDGHFRALVAQLLQVENLPIGEEGDNESWLEIITSLSWEAATLLKPDTSKSAGMDPGGYVKVKCIASGRRCESMVVKGVVCKKNVAHRRMASKMEKPRLLILGGALEYHRVSNLLSSVDTLLQQEMDHLKMAVAKISSNQPNVLLVEKSVSRYAQEYLLAKDISLVLNIKKPLLERISRCTGAQIVPSIDHLSSPKLGYCENFHVERFSEECGTAQQKGKKLVKTLMFFEGCPKPLGCTILLRGANGDELKKVKHVVQYGIFAAYHLALETSFLADEGASLPELPMSTPLTVTLPEKPSSIERSISTVPGFSVSSNLKPQGSQASGDEQQSESAASSDRVSSISSSSSLVQGKSLLSDSSGSPKQSLPSSINFVSSAPLGQVMDPYRKNNAINQSLKQKKEFVSRLSLDVRISVANRQVANGFGPLKATAVTNNFQNGFGFMADQPSNAGGVPLPQDGKDNSGGAASLKEEFPPSPAEHQSILVNLSSRCVWKGTVCERSHLFRIKYYGSFDKPLGRFLRDHLFDQNYRCHSCDMPSEAHVHCYTHRQGTLTISVKKLPEFLLPGEKEGKIWMWHRCLCCPRINGFPPATRRVVMSDVAWGLSFGKFLELSFSNHAAASRVASCGHSLHRDCLRFYGFGQMVACFRYASIDVLSVYLLPATLDFNHENQEWIRKEANEVVIRAELLFSEVLSAIDQISDHHSGMKKIESRRYMADLKEMLQKEKAEFEESLQKTLNKEVKKGHPPVDILDINRLRRQLLFHSYMWDHRLIYIGKSYNNSLHDGLVGLISEHEERSVSTTAKLSEMNLPGNASKSFSGYDSFLADVELSLRQGQSSHTDVVCQQIDMNLDLNCGKEDEPNLPSGLDACDQTNHLESDSSIHRSLSEGQFTLAENLSETLDAAWTGESQSGNSLPSRSLPDPATGDSATAVTGLEGLSLEGCVADKGALRATQSFSPMLPTKGSANVEDPVSWLKVPFYSFYCSLNKNFLGSAYKLDTLAEYTPVYVSSVPNSEIQCGARLLLPVGVNDTVIPVFDDEPTSIISYALMSPNYHIQVSDEGEKPKNSSKVLASVVTSDSMGTQSVHSSDEFFSDSNRSFSAIEESYLPLIGSRSSVLDPVTCTKALHVRVFFTDDGPQGKVKYSVTCYYAKRFEGLRRICCPSEQDFVRSLSRCKKWGAQGGKSNVFFAKTLDDRFIIKQVTKTELESFIKFGPNYFKYLSESISMGGPSCLAKILGIYQITSKHCKGGKESRMDVLVMENLLYGRNFTRVYDLKGSTRSRYNADTTKNKVLLDQNLIEAMPTAPIFVGNKAKRLLERAVWNDSSFLASVDVMDYSLLVGVDEERHELVIGIIDFMRQYTWDKHLETWVKASGILGGPKNASPTVISPKQYKKRFRKAMTTYFLMVPDQWSPPSLFACEDNAQGRCIA